MRKKVVVLSLIKNEIIIKNKKKKIDFSRVYLYMSISVIFFCICIFSLNTNFSTRVANVFNPVNSLYSDNSDVVFTGSNNIKLEFSLPILGASVENNNGVLEFTVGKSIMIMAPESGVVVEMGNTLDNIKYIKIKHNDYTYSVIENVDIIGVAEYDIVKKGQDIATSKIGEIVKLKIYENDVLINNLEVNQSKITWQN